MTDRNDVRSAVEVYLDSLNVTLFLDWDITSEDRKAKAIEYVTDLFLIIETQIEKQFPSPAALKDAFAEGVTEAMDVDAPRDWVEDEGETGAEVAQRLSSRRAAMRRHPSYQGALDPVADSSWPG